MSADLGLEMVRTFVELHHIRHRRVNIKRHLGLDDVVDNHKPHQPAVVFVLLVHDLDEIDLLAIRSVVEVFDNRAVGVHECKDVRDSHTIPIGTIDEH